MKKTLLSVSLALNIYAQGTPAFHVQAENLSDGEIRLNWELAPAEGLVEDFDDGVAQDFCSPHLCQFNIPKEGIIQSRMVMSRWYPAITMIGHRLLILLLNFKILLAQLKLDIFKVSGSQSQLYFVLMDSEKLI